MEKQYKHSFEKLLGVSPPWSITNVAISESQNCIDIYVATQSDKSFFGGMGVRSGDKTIKARWMHSNLGGLNCFIVMDVPDVSAGNGIRKEVASQPEYIGEPNKRYTNGLRQRVAVAQLRGLDAQAISSLLCVDFTVIQLILGDLNNSSQTERWLSCLPVESDPIWREVLLDKLILKTQMLPLRLLLSKLKLASIGVENVSKVSASIKELRQFFIVHAANMENEIAQICRLPMTKTAVAKRRTESTRLVLPALKSAIWVQILTGRINLKSSNMSLNLLLVRQKSAFQNTEENEVKVRAISALREFFKKNARSLRQELVAINKLLNQQKTSQKKVSLPDSNHRVWQKILQDESYIPSEHMAYRLLLSKLRSSLKLNSDSNDLQLGAAKRLRSFYAQNQRSMQRELRLVIQQSGSL